MDFRRKKFEILYLVHQFKKENKHWHEREAEVIFGDSSDCCFYLLSRNLMFSLYFALSFVLLCCYFVYKCILSASPQRSHFHSKAGPLHTVCQTTLMCELAVVVLLQETILLHTCLLVSLGFWFVWLCALCKATWHQLLTPGWSVDTVISVARPQCR